MPEFDGNPLNGWFGAVASHDKGRYEGVRSLTRHDWVQSLDLRDLHRDLWADSSSSWLTTGLVLYPSLIFLLQLASMFASPLKKKRGFNLE
ncbi:hypothetical protein Tco_1123377 [Tanacetum coccineum]|uniref:Uncharacterized protein n=1 Tax=Tanacetum coccineum TaxID=301880 RepID=A0ABQ5J605_9ASTR